MRKLIVNADDFGLTAGVNRAIVEAHRGGVVSSATLMANGAAFDDAVTAARSVPNLSVGCHVVLVDGTPVSPPGSLDTLLAIRSAEPGKFYSSLSAFAARAMLGGFDPVSYTHLDVYKRQALCCEQISWRGRCGY